MDIAFPYLYKMIVPLWIYYLLAFICFCYFMMGIWIQVKFGRRLKKEYVMVWTIALWIAFTEYLKWAQFDTWAQKLCLFIIYPPLPVLTIYIFFQYSKYFKERQSIEKLKAKVKSDMDSKKCYVARDKNGQIIYDRISKIFPEDK